MLGTRQHFGQRSFVFLWTVAAFFFLLHDLDCVRADVYGIDYGAEFFKVAAVSPGKPFEIKLNGHSKRKTPSAVFFGKDNRLFGEEAAGRATREPTLTIAMPRLLLGTSTEYDSNSDFVPPRSFNPYELIPDETRGTWNVLIGNDTMSPEEINANVLDYIRKMSQGIPESARDVLREAKSGKRAPFDCVLTVPAHFGQRQRQALADAAEIAGLTVLGLAVESHSAAIHMAAMKDIDNLDPPRTLHTLFYNMGSTATEACVMSFAADTSKNNSKTQIVKGLGCGGAPFGGHIGEIRIAESMVARFLDKYGTDVTDTPRIMKRVLAQATRTKMTLSANKEASFTVEQMTRDKDFQTTVTRDLFEESITASILNRLSKPIDEALQKSNVTVEMLSNVELLGAGWRIPRVQSELRTLFPPSIDIGQHLNGDEAMALGASFLAANASSSFRVRSIPFTEESFYSYRLEIDNLDEGNEPYHKSFDLVKAGAKLHGVKRVTLFVGHDIRVKLFEDNRLLDTFNVTGLASENAKGYSHLEGPKVTLVFKVDVLGLLHLDRATATWTESVQEPPVSESTKESAENETESNVTSLAPDNSTQIPNDASGKPPAVQKHTINLVVDVQHSKPLPITTEEKETAKARLKAMDVHDATLRLRAEKRNNLESAVYDARDKLDKDTFKDVTTEEERTTVSALLVQLEEWLYDEGEHADISVIQNRTDELKSLLEPMQFRADEAEYRPTLRGLVKETCNLTRIEIGKLNETRTWLPQDKIIRAIDAVDELDSWFEKTHAMQELLPKTETPVLTREETISRVNQALKAYENLRKIKKPVEKKEKVVQSENVAEAERNESATLDSESGASRDDNDEPVTSQNEAPGSDADNGEYTPTQDEKSPDKNDASVPSQDEDLLRSHTNNEHVLSDGDIGEGTEQHDEKPLEDSETGAKVSTEGHTDDARGDGHTDDAKGDENIHSDQIAENDLKEEL